MQAGPHTNFRCLSSSWTASGRQIMIDEKSSTVILVMFLLLRQLTFVDKEGPWDDLDTEDIDCMVCLNW